MTDETVHDSLAGQRVETDSRFYSRRLTRFSSELFEPSDAG